MENSQTQQSGRSWKIEVIVKLCKYGHERIPENVYKNGKCKLCMKAYLKIYRQKPEYREYLKKYHQKPEFIAYQKAYGQTPERKGLQKGLT